MRSKRRIAVIDSETDPFENNVIPEPFVWGYYDGDIFKYFWGDTPEECNDAIVGYIKDKDLIIYAHNGGKFDFFFLLAYINRDLMSIHGGRIVRAEIGLAELRDSYSIIPIPLSAYKKDDFDYNKMKRDVRNQHKQEIIKYLESDCKYLFELVSNFTERFGRKLTIASAAMSELRKNMGNPRFHRFSLQRDTHFRKYYYGGRCEAIKAGELKGPFEIFDINSAYPYAMLDNHPSPFNSHFRVTETMPDLETNGAIMISLKGVANGCLPYRDLDTLALTFPRDKVIREYHVTGWEVKAGLDSGSLDIKEIIECRIPEETISFSPFIQPYYEERMSAKAKGDALTVLFNKLIMNSAYGKFALNPMAFKEFQLVDIGEFPDNEAADGWGEWELVQSFMNFGIDVHSRPNPDENGFYNVATAASITGYVRAYLWRILQSSESPIYCDTDSIACKKLSTDAVLGNGLGQWDSEGKVKTAYVAGKKLYAFNMVGGGWKTASKGIRVGPEEIVRIAKDPAEVIEWYSEIPTFSVTRGQSFLSRKVRRTA